MTSVIAHPGPPPHTAPASHEPGEVSGGLASVNAAKTTAGVHTGDVRATLNFYNPPADGNAPFNYVEKPPPGNPQRNFSDSDHEVLIHDARGKEEMFDLDRHAFTVVTGQADNPAIDWDDDESVKKHYYPEVEQLLLHSIPGLPSRVLLFDHTIRRALPNSHRAPVTRAHIDQTPKSAKLRVEFHLPDEAEEIFARQTRYRIINVWRPLNGQVQSFPLAFANSETVPDDDMVPVAHRYPDRVGETAAVRHNAQHEWWYLSGMDNSERLFLQCYDSERPMNRVPHSAFTDPRSTEESKPRESIEVRALVFG